jgi:hypothetical protein
LSGLFGSFDQSKLDKLAARLLSVIAAIVEYARPTDDAEDDVDTVFFDAAVLKALLTSLAANVVHDHTDDEQDEELILAMIEFLRAEVKFLRAQS